MRHSTSLILLLLTTICCAESVAASSVTALNWRVGSVDTLVTGFSSFDYSTGNEGYTYNLNVGSATQIRFTVVLDAYNANIYGQMDIPADGYTAGDMFLDTDQKTYYTDLVTVGTKTVTLTLTDDTYQWQFTINLGGSLSSDDTLSTLSISAGTLSPSFVATTRSYSASVAGTVTAITFSASPASSVYSVFQSQFPGDSSYSTFTTSRTYSSLALGSNVFYLRVTAQDGTTQVPYVVTITRVASTVSSLASLTCTRAITETFSSSTYTYTSSTGYTSTTAKVTLKVTDTSYSTVSYVFNTNTAIAASAVDYSSATAITLGNGLSGTTLGQGNTATLSISVGANVFNFRVASQAGTYSYYRVTVTRASPSSTVLLSTLTISSPSGVTFSPSFTSGTTSYVLSVLNSATSASIVATPSLSLMNVYYYINSTAFGVDASNSYTAATMSAGSGTVPVTLPIGYTFLTIRVTAQDGVTYGYYHVRITRPTQDARLSGLNVNDDSSITLTPTFDPDTYTYSATVAYSVKTAYLTATLNNIVDGNLVGFATGSDDPTTLSYSSESISNGVSSTPTTALLVGLNYLNLQIVAVDHAYIKYYRVVVEQLAPSTTATLTSLVPTVGTLSPTFDNSIDTYTMTVSYQSQFLSFDGTLGETDSSMFYATGHNPASAVPSGEWVDLNFQEGTGNTPSIELVVGVNYIDFQIRPLDEEGTARNFLVAITRSLASTDATLMALAPSAGVLAPPFASSTYYYEFMVTNSISSMTLSATLTYQFATIESAFGVSPTSFTSLTPTSKVAVSPIWNLNVGWQLLTFRVTAEDATTQLSYVANVTRAISDDATLTAITTNRGSISPVFNAAGFSYTIALSQSTTSIMVSVIVHNSLATVGYSTTMTSDAASTLTYSSLTVSSLTASTPSLSVAIGTTNLYFRIRASDGTTLYYRLAVNRAAPSTDAYLSLLSSNVGVLSPSFVFSQPNYAVAMSPTTSSLNLTATVRTTGGTLYYKVLTYSEAMGSLSSVTFTNSVTLSAGTAVIPSGTVAVGLAYIGIKSIAQDGSTAAYYLVTITRLSTVSSLSSLNVGAAGTLSPTFSSSTFTYNVTVPYSSSTISVNAQMTDTLPGTSVRYAIGAPDATKGEYNTITVTSGAASTPSISLATGLNYIDIQSIASDTVTSSFYQVQVSRQVADSVSSFKSVTTTPVISFTTSDSVTYSATIPSSVNFLTVSVEVDSVLSSFSYTSGTNVAVTAASATGYQGVALNGTTASTTSLTLSPGNNLIYLKCVAQDGVLTTYVTLNIFRMDVISIEVLTAGLNPITFSPAFGISRSGASASANVATSIMAVALRVSFTTAASISYSVDGTAASDTLVSGVVSSNTISLVVGATVISLQSAVDGSTYVLTIHRAGGVVGDPQLFGFRGQSFQVHGVAGQYYSLLSYYSLQMNALFTFRSKGYCGAPLGIGECWSHPGSYIGKTGFRIALRSGKTMFVEVDSDSWDKGLHVRVNGLALPVSETMQVYRDFEETTEEAEQRAIQAAAGKKFESKQSKVLEKAQALDAALFASELPDSRINARDFKRRLRTRSPAAAAAASSASPRKLLSVTEQAQGGEESEAELTARLEAEFVEESGGLQLGAKLTNAVKAAAPMTLQRAEEILATTQHQRHEESDTNQRAGTVIEVSGVETTDECRDNLLIAGSFPILDAASQGLEVKDGAKPAKKRQTCSRKQSSEKLSEAAKPLPASIQAQIVPLRLGTVHILHASPRVVIVSTLDFTVKLINSDHFLNQEIEYHTLDKILPYDREEEDFSNIVDITGLHSSVAKIAVLPTIASLTDSTLASYGVHVPHGLIGCTWRARRYKNQWGSIPGHVEDYVVDGVYATEFAYSRWSDNRGNFTTVDPIDPGKIDELIRKRQPLLQVVKQK